MAFNQWSRSSNLTFPGANMICTYMPWLKCLKLVWSGRSVVIFLGWKVRVLFISLGAKLPGSYISWCQNDNKNANLKSYMPCMGQNDSGFIDVIYFTWTKGSGLTYIPWCQNDRILHPLGPNLSNLTSPGTKMIGFYNPFDENLRALHPLGPKDQVLCPHGRKWSGLKSPEAKIIGAYILCGQMIGSYIPWDQNYRVSHPLWPICPGLTSP